VFGSFLTGYWLFAEMELSWNTVHTKFGRVTWFDT